MSLPNPSPPSTPESLKLIRSTSAPADIFITDSESFELADIPTASSTQGTFAAPIASTAPTSHQHTNSSSSNIHSLISSPLAIRKGINNRNTTATGEWRTSRALTEQGTDFMHNLIDDNEQRIEVREEERRRRVRESESGNRPGTALGGSRLLGERKLRKMERRESMRRGERPDPNMVFEAFVNEEYLGVGEQEVRRGMFRRAVRWVKGAWKKGKERGRKAFAPREPFHQERI
ncbi:hypothetical protein NX059_008628 [Plenodomus lindquistii]|nr:hypothetical protein NX059_008628 [Plenodomus lindquistii]